ncbi:glycoside hydrolase [Sinomicrobium kalidii]|uniref:MGH1-like glycoside hydrolase domain-containing protein n=1 Tax=Sinomicrobium kalidii TaxID=2900738 RepID=UPI001E54127A|nr:glycosyl hydrolase family 65 protein [Sinomicrobium kalidii]UGU15767.1 glycoside hydrolase [Sinomicrobium kalidii]
MQDKMKEKNIFGEKINEFLKKRSLQNFPVTPTPSINSGQAEVEGFHRQKYPDSVRCNRTGFRNFFYCILLLCALAACNHPEKREPAILKAGDFEHYATYFNRMEDENIKQAIPNDSAWTWMKANIPLFECPQDNFEELYYYRWWSVRKHIKNTPQGYAVTEFLVERSYADKYNLISCALGHHIHELRWLHNPEYLDQNVHLWYRGKDGGRMNKLRSFSSWTASSLYDRYLVDGDKEFLLDMFPDLVDEYKAWEGDRRRPDGLFWQYDVKDGMEESLSGSRHEKNARPTINSYMFGNARAIAKMAEMKGETELVGLYEAKADTLRRLVQQKLWNPADRFFETNKEADSSANVREAIGFIPWYFNLPEQGKGYETAWQQVKDEEGFLAPFGLTTAERRSPRFRTHGTGTCEWDGAVWPFATSQTMTAMANVLNHYRQEYVDQEDYFTLMNLYVESQYYRGRPYIGEYLDETTGYWLMGDRERSRYYNHSTFNDLIITGLVGLRPRADEKIEINPLIPEEKWDWFCLDNVLYHGYYLTILWDRTGEKYGKGKGLRIFRNGKEIAASEKLERIVTE